MLAGTAIDALGPSAQPLVVGGVRATSRDEIKGHRTLDIAQSILIASAVYASYWRTASNSSSGCVLALPNRSELAYLYTLTGDHLPHALPQNGMDATWAMIPEWREGSVIPRERDAYARSVAHRACMTALLNDHALARLVPET